MAGPQLPQRGTGTKKEFTCIKPGQTFVLPCKVRKINYAHGDPGTNHGRREVSGGRHWSLLMVFLTAHRVLSRWNLIAGEVIGRQVMRGKLTFGLISIMKWVLSRGSVFLSPKCSRKVRKPQKVCYRALSMHLMLVRWSKDTKFYSKTRILNEGNTIQYSGQGHRIRIPAFQLITLMTLNKLLNLSGLQFLLWNRDWNNSEF